jgi:hypothetical protein
MAKTHTFANANEAVLGGAWSDDAGRPFCSWTWDHASRKLTVTCGNQGKSKKLPSFEAAELSDEQLRKRLPRLALELAEQIKESRPGK